MPAILPSPFRAPWSVSTLFRAGNTVEMVIAKVPVGLNVATSPVGVLKHDVDMAKTKFVTFTVVPLPCARVTENG